MSQNIIPPIKNVSKHQRSHYRNIRKDLLGTGRGYLGIRGAHVGNHCLKETRRYWNLKEEVLACTLWTGSFRRGYGLLAKQTTK